MKFAYVCLVVLAAVLVVPEVSALDKSFAAYYTSWPQYRQGKFKYTPDDLKPAIPMLDKVLYGFAFFDNETMELYNVEPKDFEFFDQINSFKSIRPFKFMLSVGGWTFPSFKFSQMVSTKENRAKFIASCLDWMNKYGFDGIDIDWEYPCSAPRINHVKISDDNFTVIVDDGGKCPDDKDNLPLLIKEMYEAFEPLGKTIGIATQAARKNWENMDLPSYQQYIEHFHVMNYDYTVSDILESNVTAPNQPLFNPISGPNMSVNQTIVGYLEMGLDPNLLSMGLAYYGHTWYVPNPPNGMWQSYGILAEKQYGCFGPFKDTYGYGPFQGSNQCGLIMYSEQEMQNFETYWDEVTQSEIGYDASTGLWNSMASMRSLKRLTQYAVDMGLGSIFIFDSSMDSVTEEGEFTYEVTHALCELFMGDECYKGHNPPGPPAPPPGGNCDGKPQGYFCIDTSTYTVCPQDVTLHCAPGTTCHQHGNQIECS